MVSLAQVEGEERRYRLASSNRSQSHKGIDSKRHPLRSHHEKPIPTEGNIMAYHSLFIDQRRTILWDRALKQQDLMLSRGRQCQNLFESEDIQLVSGEWENYLSLSLPSIIPPKHIQGNWCQIFMVLSQVYGTGKFLYIQLEKDRKSIAFK